MISHYRTIVSAAAAAVAMLAAPLAAQPDDPRPSASDPVRERRTAPPGKPAEVVVHRIGAVAWDATIAQRHWLARRLAHVTVPTDFALECAINPFGRATRECAATDNPRTLADEYGAYALADVVIASLPLFPRAEDAVTMRRAAFTARYDPATAPTLDLASGPLLADDQLREIRPTGIKYPPRALAVSAEAAISGECQVQADLSVVCHTLAVDSLRPDLFQGLVEAERPRSRRAPAALPDGRPTPGMRVPFRLSFRMAQ